MARLTRVHVQLSGRALQVYHLLRMPEESHPGRMQRKRDAPHLRFCDCVQCHFPFIARSDVLHLSYEFVDALLDSTLANMLGHLVSQVQLATEVRVAVLTQSKPRVCSNALIKKLLTELTE